MKTTIIYTALIITHQFAILCDLVMLNKHFECDLSHMNQLNQSKCEIMCSHSRLIDKYSGNDSSTGICPVTHENAHLLKCHCMTCKIFISLMDAVWWVRTIGDSLSRYNYAQVGENQRFYATSGKPDSENRPFCWWRHKGNAIVA